MDTIAGNNSPSIDGGLQAGGPIFGANFEADGPTAGNGPEAEDLIAADGAQAIGSAADGACAPRDPTAYGELGRRALELNDRETLSADEVIDAFLDWTIEAGIELWPHQEEACMSLMMDDHVILGTPTGSGKSMVALAMHFLALAMGRHAYYTAPIKALVNEKFFDLVELLGRENVGMITGDTRINTDAPIVCCTAEILANQALREGDACDIDYVAMDEFHFFADPDRGWAWQVPLLTMPRTRFLLMSATLGDMTQIADALETQTGRAVDAILDAERPVPLTYEYVETPLEGTVELAVRDGDAPIYIVHFSQDAALACAQSLSSFGLASKDQRVAIKEAMSGTRFSTAFGKTLKRLLEAGIGVHHAGMLPRYRLLVEKLAQQGIIPIICGTDTLGVGINVPIRTVVLTALSKYDGRRMRRLRSREFHQIVGRAGRSGFDTEGRVIAEAPEQDIEYAKALAKAGNDEKKRRRVKRKATPEGFVGWNKQAFERLIEAAPETLKPRMRITHAIVLAEVEQAGDAWTRTCRLIDDSLQTAEEKTALKTRAAEIFQTLMDAGVVERLTDEEGGTAYATTVDLPDDFALDQPLSPFMLAALELLDPESEAYALDVISMVESTLEDPRQVLRAQERRAKDRAMASMKAEGIDYEERLEKIADVTYPKPLEELLEAAFAQYCESVPWANDYTLRPKSVLRDMVETAANFKGYVTSYNIARSEGTLLRYLSDAYRVLAKTIPSDKRDERLRDIVSWLGFVVRSVDSSLIDAWESAGEAEDIAAPEAADVVVHDRRAVTLLVRNALFARVRLAARGRAAELGELDADWGYGTRAWQQALDGLFEAHEEILTDADARSTAYFTIDESDEASRHVWRVTQTFHDADGDRDFGIRADVDLDATQESGEVVFSRYRVGAFEELQD